MPSRDFFYPNSELIACYLSYNNTEQTTNFNFSNMKVDDDEVWKPENIKC
jgi:hypothetical protein